MIAGPLTDSVDDVVEEEVVVVDVVGLVPPLLLLLLLLWPLRVVDCPLVERLEVDTAELELEAPVVEETEEDNSVEDDEDVETFVGTSGPILAPPTATKPKIAMTAMNSTAITTVILEEDFNLYIPFVFFDCRNGHAIMLNSRPEF